MKGKTFYIPNVRSDKQFWIKGEQIGQILREYFRTKLGRALLKIFQGNEYFLKSSDM